MITIYYDDVLGKPDLKYDNNTTLFKKGKLSEFIGEVITKLEEDEKLSEGF